MSESPTNQAATTTEAAVEAPAAPTKTSRGVRWEPDEEAWLGRLEARMYEAMPGARPSFAATVREAMSWARLLLGDDAGASRVRQLEELRLDFMRTGCGSPSVRDVAAMVIEAGFEAVRARVPRTPTAADLAGRDVLEGNGQGGGA